MLIYSINTGLFLFEKHYILGMVYTSRTFRSKKREKFLSFKQYFKVFKFETTFSYCQMILMVRVLHQSSLGTKKAKNYHEKFISLFFFDLWWVSTSRINDSHPIPTLLSQWKEIHITLDLSWVS